LAQSFNRLARELAENQQRLVDTQLQRLLLQVENERKSHELEEARVFQLSLLPKALPDHPHVEVAVFMRTATEVGDPGARR
jgi:sigma-B regulation protein RsbU (phosphoserine phosphatase)